MGKGKTKAKGKGKNVKVSAPSDFSGDKTLMTVIELEDFMRRTIPPGISRESIYNHIRKGGIVLDGKHRVDVNEFLKVYKQHKVDDNKNGKPAGLEPSQDPSKYKVALQCMMLKEQLDEKRGLSVPISSVLQWARIIMDIVKGVYAQDIASIKVESDNPQFIKRFEQRREESLLWMAKEFKQKLRKDL